MDTTNIIKKNIESNIPYPFQNIDYKIKLLLLTAKILMENGASTAQIKRDLYRASLFLELPEGSVDSHINYSTIMLNAKVNINNSTANKNDVEENEDVEMIDPSFSKSSFIKSKFAKRGINLSVTSLVSRLIWRATKRNYSMERFEQELHKINHMPKNYSIRIEAIGAGLTCGGLCYLFGGDLMASIITLFCTLLGFGAKRLCNLYRFNPYASITIATFVSTFMACLIYMLSDGVSSIYPIIASSIFLIPGIPLINAIDDMLSGYLISGITRTVDTVFSIGSIAFGIVLALFFFASQDITSLSIKPDDLSIWHAVASSVTALGLSIMFNLPRKLLPVVAIGGLIAVDLRNLLVIQYGCSMIFGTFIGATVVGIAGQLINHYIHTPNSLITIPSVIPLVPGVLLYRTLYAILNINTMEPVVFFESMRNGIEAGIIVLAITIGITIPMIFFRPYIENAQRKEIEELLVQRYLPKEA